jgi:hypothetical protein
MAIKHFYLTINQERPNRVSLLAVLSQMDPKQRFAFALAGVVG